MAKKREKSEEYLGKCYDVADSRADGVSNFRISSIYQISREDVPRMADDHELASLGDRFLINGTDAELRRFVRMARWRGFGIGKMAESAGVSVARLRKAGGAKALVKRASDPFGMFDALLCRAKRWSWEDAGKEAYGLKDGRGAAVRATREAEKMGLLDLVDLVTPRRFYKIDRTARLRIGWALKNEKEIWRRML